ncbi:radical SAM protein [Natroniella acetigena]|uniref:radical SAM/SPASM domain-containing protein n=1 Tax=Natroniella acetigena TaxID=52004 RepID=UPI00200B2E02|nr:radical SAM protein [Natroniella acetigena]MCK8828087.1 radical SAM protein [Natroniella acetigena]
MIKKRWEKNQKDMLENVRIAIEKAQNKNEYPNHFDMPMGIQYELTTKCNMKCIHCYNKSGETDNSLMKIDDWIELTKDLIKNGGLFQCIISGGEPLLLGDNLLKIMDLLHNDNTVFTLISNGYLLDEEWIKKLAKYRFNRFQISIDNSIEEEHDQFRQKKGSWRRAVKAAYLASENNFPLVIASSVTPQNIVRMKDMAELAYNLGASSLIFGKIMLSGRAAENNNIILKEEQEEQFLRNVEILRREYLGSMNIQVSSNLKNQLERLRTTPMSGVIIRPNGDVRLDCSLPFVIGNILEDSFKDIWNNKAKDSLNNPKVREYIECLDENESSFLTNYVDEDIYI